MSKWSYRTVAGSVVVTCLALASLHHSAVALVLGAALFLVMAIVRPA
jgi:hypothetical protein